MSLTKDLKAYRITKSLAEKTPIYCIFGDTVLNSIVREKPINILDLSKIRGFDTEKCAKYGMDIIFIVANATESIPSPLVRVNKDEVYILELAMDKVYVGKSSNVSKRIRDHQMGLGSIFTKFYPPTGRLLPRLGDVRGSGDCAGNKFDKSSMKIYSKLTHIIIFLQKGMRP